MLIEAVIHAVDTICPNQYGTPEKVKWLSDLDGQIYRDIISTHQDAAVDSFDGYGPDTNLEETELLIAHPYDEVYRWYLEMMIDKANGELAKYNVAASLYNQVYLSFMDYYNRTHTPISQVAAFRI